MREDMENAAQKRIRLLPRLATLVALALSASNLPAGVTEEDRVRRVNVVLTVTDTQTGTVKTYVNPQATPFPAIQDTDAFAVCP
jgi:hypothetical protein